jgi:hypothetical protein
VTSVLAAFLPGLFFEACVAMASPRIAELLITRANLLHRYAPVIVALLVAFVVGNAFILWVQLIQSVTRKVFMGLSRLGLWDAVVRRLSLRASKSHAARVQNPPGPTSPSLYFRFIHWLEGRNFEQEREWREVCDEWAHVATALLKRYGVESQGRRELRPWTNVLGSVQVGDLRGYMVITALHATGWSGLAAAYFAPELREAPFEGLCLFLIFCGLIQAVALASRSTHLIKSWLTGLGNTWDELKETGVSKSAEASKDSV